jgi:hypothetical protein
MRAGLRQEAVLHSPVAARLHALLLEHLEGRAPIRREAGACVIELGGARCALCVLGDRLLACCEAEEAPALRRVRALLDGHLACCAGGTPGFRWGQAQALPATAQPAPPPDLPDPGDAAPWAAMS